MLWVIRPRQPDVIQRRDDVEWGHGGCVNPCVWMSESVHTCSTSSQGAAGWAKALDMCLAAGAHRHADSRWGCNVETTSANKTPEGKRRGLKPFVSFWKLTDSHFISLTSRRSTGRCVSSRQSHKRSIPYKVLLWNTDRTDTHLTQGAGVPYLVFAGCLNPDYCGLITLVEKHHQ